MQSSLYVVLSAQLTLQKRMESIANNVANSNTAGFRAEEIRFETLLSEAPLDPVSFVSSGDTYLSRRAGEIVKTDNALDVAVEGEAWLAIQTPVGTVYTRDGRMRISDTGQLETLSGHPVLDVGGAPILIDAAAGPPQIARDGMITQNGRQVGAIGLFGIDKRAHLTRYENSGVIPDQPAVPALDFGNVGLLQGYVERSNVNPVMEMSRLIMVTRALEAVTASLNTAESNLQDAVETLGSPTG
jgi:flagellar basal-body rod protein FlgF